MRCCCTAAVALMDRSSLPKPPMTLTAELLVRPSNTGHVMTHLVCWMPLVLVSMQLLLLPRVLMRHAES